MAHGKYAAVGWPSNAGRAAWDPTAHKWRSMNTRFVVLLVMAFMLLSFGRDAVAQPNTAPRVALIIGNAKYPDAEAPLKEPISDARAMAEELRRDAFGFDVELTENLSKDGMLRAFNRLYARIKSGSVALVFFSGYAIQSNRQSYLIPVDGQIWTEADVRRDGVSLEAILKDMNSKGRSEERRVGKECRL